MSVWCSRLCQKSIFFKKKIFIPCLKLTNNTKFRTLNEERLLTIITYMLVRLTVKIFFLKFPCFFNKTYFYVHVFAVLFVCSALLCVDAYSSSIKLISNLEAKISYNVFVGKFHACMDPFKILMPTKSLSLDVYLCNSNSVDLTTAVAICVNVWCAWNK